MNLPRGCCAEYGAVRVCVCAEGHHSCDYVCGDVLVCVGTEQRPRAFGLHEGARGDAGAGAVRCVVVRSVGRLSWRNCVREETGSVVSAFCR
jgi:hypothetical protein